MKFEVEIDLNYPGIENDTLAMIQYNLQLILDRGSNTFNEENEDVYEEDEECTCTGNIVRTKPMLGLLMYYMKVATPEEYVEPTRSMFEDFQSIPSDETVDLTFDQFCKLSKKSYEAAKIRGYMLAVHSKSVEYKSADDLERIKNELRAEDGFIGFPGDKVVEDLHTPLKKMLDDDDIV